MNDIKRNAMGSFKRQTPAQVIAATAKTLREASKVSIMIPSTEKDKDDVNISINGYLFQIKRDVRVEVPQQVVEALNNAEFILYDMVPSPTGEGYDRIARTVKRIGFQVFEAASG